MALKISDEAKVQMPMKTVASLIALVAIGTWAYFGIIETQNRLSTQVELMSKDLIENTEFRIKWPRGQLGSLPADSEQFMLIEHMSGQDMMSNTVNIERLQKDVEKILSDIEKLKDKQRTFANGNGTH
jgi:hypothetical protein